ncbi:calmodulin-binding transcription activator 1-like isoform X6 [Erpetoichthys calabaricus]|uniref:calmodulin-binding transcription activator 1-like isoform X6 n=1 Tax=Erpetoichthys calabaricus TaxID=27687 RepID=UPI0022341878|nr:calmodulin-binding transcription activator 1-like isoform X6 [Erpetoichthys calabaricus]
MAAENKPEDDHGNSNGSHVKIFLPKKLLECLPKCSSLPKERHRWNTNEEIAAYLITFEKHEEWLTTSPKTRPQNGSMILYNRKKVKYRKDGYCWKKRKDGKTTREDHMKLKVQGVECLYGCYVHSSIIPTFHRRCYWLLQNPDIVLVHYLNVPAIEDCGKPCGPILCSINTDKKEWAKWTKEELIGQLKPMFHGIKWTCSNGNSSAGFSVEQLVQQILDSHQSKPQPRTHNCLCTGNLGAGSSAHHKCNSSKHRIISPKVEPRAGGYSSSHSEVQNNDVSEGKNEHSHGSGKGGAQGGREKRNGKVSKPVLLHQNSTEVTSTNQVEVPDTTQNSPVSISSGLNSDPDMADSPVVTGLTHVASVMSGLSQSTAVFMSEVTGDPVYSMSPTGGPNQHLISSDTSAQGLVLAVTSDSHKFAFPAPGSAADGLAMLSAAGVSEELVLSSSLDSVGPKIPETTMNFDPDCFLNNPKQGQTYGGGGLKTEGSNGSNANSSSNGNTSSMGRSPPVSDTTSGFGFSTTLVKTEIKTEDTSFEQQLAKETNYQVGSVVSGGSSGPGSSSSSLSLTPGTTLLPSGGGLSPSTTLEQMDFSAIDSKQEYQSSVVATGTSNYGQTVPSPHLSHQSRSPSFFLQEPPQPPPQQQVPPPANTPGSNLSESPSFMGLQVVKTENPNGGNAGHHHHHHHHHHHMHHPHQQPQHTPPNCNGGGGLGTPVDQSPTQQSSLQLLQFPAGFQPMASEHQENVNLEPNAGAQGGPGTSQNGVETGGVAESLLKSGDHLQVCGSTEHYLQQASESNTAGLRTGNGNPSNGTGTHQQLQPILQSAGLVQGLYPSVGAHQSLGSTGGMEISLDHFDISFGNQFSDLINDFISVDGGATVGPSGALYGHQLVSTGPEGQTQPGPQTGQEEGARTTYSQAELCLPACCSPQHLGGATGGGNGGNGASTDASPLSYMHVAEVVSAAVAQGALGMLQATGRLFMVTDYSPEWSYPEGGVKVLITGPWQEASNNYSCLFDQISVPASLIQPGVLRCYCPAHDTGLVTLQVAISNQIISNSVVFEYKARALPSLPSSQHDWLSLDDNQFRMSILERLEQMERRMAEMTNPHQQVSGGEGSVGGSGNTSQAQCVTGPGQAGSSFESRVVVVCEKMMGRACWAKSKHLIHSKTFRGMTLLHLAAAQGYATLIQTLIKWRTKHADSIDLELEVDPLNVDHFSCTPLMWACALGHLETAVVLYKWDRRALSIPDSLGRMPLAIARSRGHTKLAECLEQLQREDQQPPHLPPTHHLPFSHGEEATTDSWISSWSNSGAIGAMEEQKDVSGMTNLNPDLRRPRSEPSNYYSTECQRDLPVAKKHKPNPEHFQSRPDKSMSVPLILEQQQLRKLNSSPKQPLATTLSSGKDLDHESTGESTIFRGMGNISNSSSGLKWGAKDFYQQVQGGQTTSLSRKSSGGIVIGKDKLTYRLRQHEPISVLMSEGELLSYRENLENEDCLAHMEDLQVNMMTLAEQIIEATPDRIKRENFVSVDAIPLAERLDSAGVSNPMSWLASYLADVEHLPSLIQIRSFYTEPLTPSSNPSLSPASSPVSERGFDKPSFPSAADWTDFLTASNNKVERELAQLTLSDPEQRELYEAARLVQSAFRKYKGRSLREQQEVAAAVIQRCYRKYKQLTWIALKYALYKKMTQAAILIQSKFRSYHEQKKFQQSRRAAVLIQQYYRSYKEFGRLRPNRRSHKLNLLTKKQDQAARKIMRFLRRCRHSPLMDHRLYKRSERIEKGQGT